MVVVAAVSLASAAVFMLLRKDMPLPFPAFEGACERLRASGLAVTARDWFCQPAPWSAHAAYATASLLIAVGFALPCAILAATGRRITALLPLVAAPAMVYPSLLFTNPFRWWSGASWPHGAIAAAATTLLLVIGPAVMVAVLFPRSHRRPVPVSLAGGAAAAAACSVSVLPLAYVTDRMFARHFAAVGGSGGIGDLLWPAIAIGLFAGLLGPDRRWWPWSLAPTALLLSMGPSLAMSVGPEHLVDWSRFGAVLPLFGVGLVGSAWRPIAVRLTRLIPPDVQKDASSDSPPGPSIELTRLRPATLFNALAIAVLVTSFVAFRADPLPVQINTPLPTYLGERIAVQDVRVKMDLLLAIDAMDRYRETAGTYEGFDAKTGAEIRPELSWTNVPATVTAPLTMWIVTATHGVARVTGVSNSGDAFCIQRTPDALSYGMATGHAGTAATLARARAAISACGTRPWCAAAVQPPPFEQMCDGLDASGGYLICRMVQALNSKELSQSKPA